MRSFLRRLSTVFLAALILVSPAFAFAVQSSQSETPTRNMIRSERSIRSIIAEKNSDIRSTLFIEFVNSRLKYVTVRSLSKLTGSKWLGYVDLVENWITESMSLTCSIRASSNKDAHASRRNGFRNPDHRRRIGNHQIRRRDSVFLFQHEARRNCPRGSCVLKCRVLQDHYDIDLFEYYPDELAERRRCPGRHGRCLRGLCLRLRSIQLVDHAVLKLKSYVSNSDTQKRNYIWELYLVHGDELPASATLIRYSPDTKTAKVFSRTLRNYF